MKYLLTKEKINFYQENGFVVIEDFLSPEEVEDWRSKVMSAIKDRAGKKMPGKDIKVGEDDGINDDTEYFGKVFDQLINLWQTDEGVKKLMMDERIGRMAADLAGVDGIRIWHDQALFKRPWANPTAWHLDTPFGPFRTGRLYLSGLHWTMLHWKTAVCILYRDPFIVRLSKMPALARTWMGYSRYTRNSLILLRWPLR